MSSNRKRPHSTATACTAHPAPPLAPLPPPGLLPKYQEGLLRLLHNPPLLDRITEGFDTPGLLQTIAEHFPRRKPAHLEHASNKDRSRSSLTSTRDNRRQFALEPHRGRRHPLTYLTPPAPFPGNICLYPKQTLQETIEQVVGRLFSRNRNCNNKVTSTQKRLSGPRWVPLGRL